MQSALCLSPFLTPAVWRRHGYSWSDVKRTLESKVHTSKDLIRLADHLGMTIDAQWFSAGHRHVTDVQTPQTSRIRSMVERFLQREIGEWPSVSVLDQLSTVCLDVPLPVHYVPKSLWDTLKAAKPRRQRGSDWHHASRLWSFLRKVWVVWTCHDDFSLQTEPPVVMTTTGQAAAHSTHTAQSSKQSSRSTDTGTPRARGSVKQDRKRMWRSSEWIEFQRVEAVADDTTVRKHGEHIVYQPETDDTEFSSSTPLLRFRLTQEVCLLRPKATADLPASRCQQPRVWVPKTNTQPRDRSASPLSDRRRRSTR